MTERGGYWRNKTHCIRGHEFTDKNTKRNSGGSRVCLTCSRMHKDKWNESYPIERAKAYRKYSWKYQGIVDFTTEDYENLYAAQNGQCAICGRSIKIYTTGRLVDSANVDHDHKTGKVRGLLCRSCNVGLGLFGDKEETLISALCYIGRT